MRPDSATTMRHRQAWELLPWYVNGSLDGDELERFEAHLAGCEVCRSELVVEERWAREIRASEELVYSPDRAFAELRGRLAGSERDRAGASRAEGSRLGRLWRRAGGETSGALRFALLAQAAAIVALVAVLWLEPAPAEFRTVSDPVAESAVEGAAVRVVFAEGATEVDLRELLLGVGARLVDGPSPHGVYTLEVPASRIEPAVESLRQNELVRLAEPL